MNIKINNLCLVLNLIFMIYSSKYTRLTRDEIDVSTS